MTEAAIHATGLSKRFGDLVAVEHLDLDVRRGEIFGVLGPNGSGKTTTLRLLSGLMPPSSGEIHVVGIDAVRDPEAVRRRIGYMSQKFGLYVDLTVAENFAFYAGLYGLRGDARRARRAELFRALGLESRAAQLAGTLSGGWKQKLALACATAHHPDLVLLDEPTAGVDPAARRRFWEIIHELAQGGMTILVTTHYMDEATQCDRLAFLSRGHLIGLGTPDEITAQFNQPTIEDVFIALQAKDEGEPS